MYQVEQETFKLEPLFSRKKALLNFWLLRIRILKNYMPISAL